MREVIKIFRNFSAFRRLLMILSMLSGLGCGSYQGPPPGAVFYYEGPFDEFGEEEEEEEDGR
jgi:hypothetical protein